MPKITGRVEQEMERMLDIDYDEPTTALYKFRAAIIELAQVVDALEARQ